MSIPIHFAKTKRQNRRRHFMTLYRFLSTLFFWYNRLMEILRNSIMLMSHFIFIAIFYNLLINLFDWGKIVKRASENIGRLKLFLLFISIVIGYMVSTFIWSVISLSQDIFFAI